MSSDREALEKILGGAVEQRGQRAVPGSSPVEGVEFVYYEDDGKSKAKKQFNALLDSAGVITATSGGVVSDSCKIHLPDGLQFHALSYHGDIEGWREAVEAGAKARGLLLARIDGEQFVVSDGRSIPLSGCKVEFP
ncbi:MULTISPECIES: hypothetical protein [Pseudomonas]|uniref:hypothetical protein n=1 Tax=Pseudomonas TaxID=286 RepID=UPI0015A3E408|nr:hypothetical protein [Pseudomonas gingeri]NVZ99448.1 hypothetical protein [Pseudomonas gingeri]NWA15530.1 hypothetical protein [Pseudomonas gingeri]NWA56757.1 hypothetical protein [Pseudomonas gingeri]NWA95251.1 hypothetical protein [Pseudomonas gingeri]NWB05333.1 hypothetical protein [Pseudomonas gingeri]